MKILALLLAFLYLSSAEARVEIQTGSRTGKRTHLEATTKSFKTGPYECETTFTNNSKEGYEFLFVTCNANGVFVSIGQSCYKAIGKKIPDDPETETIVAGSMNANDQTMFFTTKPGTKDTEQYLVTLHCVPNPKEELKNLKRLQNKNG